MSESSLKIYRDPSLQKIEPIDLISIPDDLRCEIRRLQVHIDGSYKATRGILEKRARRAGLWAGATVTLPILIVSVLSFLHGSWGLKPLLLVPAVTVVLNLLLVSIMYERALPKTEEVREIVAHREAMNRRLSKLQSLDRLTDQSKHAAALLDESRAFNRDLENIGIEACSHSEAMVIVEKHAGILARIADFRKKVLDVPENRLLLLFPTLPDDRT